MSQDIQDLLDQISLLKVRNTVLEDQVLFHKYKYKLLKISTLNHSDNLIGVEILFRDQVLKYKIPTNYKIISFKRLIYEDVKTLISEMTLCFDDEKENVLENEFTIDDYLIKDGARLLLKTRDFIVKVNGSYFTISKELVISDLRKQLGQNSSFYVIASSGKLLQDTFKLCDLTLSCNLILKKYKVNIMEADKKLNCYGIDAPEEIRSFKEITFIPSNIEDQLELRGKSAEGLSLQLAKWRVKLDHDRLKKEMVVVNDLNTSISSLRSLLQLKGKFDLQIFDNKLGNFQVIKKEQKTLGDLIDPYRDMIIVFRRVQYVPIPLNDKIVKLVDYHGLSPDNLIEQLGTHFVVSTFNNVVRPKPTWAKLSDVKLTRFKFTIYNFEDEELYDVGIDYSDRDKTLDEIFNNVDNLLFDSLRDIISVVGKKQLFIHDLKTTKISYLLSLFHQNGTNSLSLKIFRKLQISRLSDKDKKMVTYGYNIYTTVQMLKDFIKTIEDTSIKIFNLLYCKKTSNKKGFVDLQRYYSYELLTNCIPDRDSNMIYYEIPMDKPITNEEYKQTYVVEYSKLQKIGMLNGIVKTYKTRCD